MGFVAPDGSVINGLWLINNMDVAMWTLLGDAVYPWSSVGSGQVGQGSLCCCCPPHLGLGFACGLSFTTVHVKGDLGGINVRDADYQKPKYYLGVASFCCRFEVLSFHLNTFIERVYNSGCNSEALGSESWCYSTTNWISSMRWRLAEQAGNM